MTQYLICDSHDDAVAISARVAREQGCTGDVTETWFAVQDHPTDGRTAIIVDDPALLTQDERAALSDELSADWTTVPYPTD